MKAHIVRIGNSRGIRLPKTLLQEAQLEDEVELQAEPGRILSQMKLTRASPSYCSKFR